MISTMFGFSPLELAVVCLLVVVLFGSKRLPELGTGLGAAINNFKKSFKEAETIDVTPKKDDEKKENTK